MLGEKTVAGLGLFCGGFLYGRVAGLDIFGFDSDRLPKFGGDTARIFGRGKAGPPIFA